jgi:membrane protein DedA with SNARE-associated domain
MFRKFHAFLSPMRSETRARAFAFSKGGPGTRISIAGHVPGSGADRCRRIASAFCVDRDLFAGVVRSRPRRRHRGAWLHGHTRHQRTGDDGATRSLAPARCATLGAIAGDGFSFWLGMRYHAEVLHGWPLNRYPQLIARSKAYIEHYGIASVFIARFTAVVRAFVPMLAGVLRMSPPHFYAANVASALVWAPLHVFPGVLLVMAISLAGIRAERLILLVLAAAVLASTLWGLLRARSRERAAAPTRPLRLLAMRERTRHSGR